MAFLCASITIAAALIIAVEASEPMSFSPIGSRSLQEAVGCLTTGKSFMECCPGVDPNDGICTMLWCVDLDNSSIKDECSCVQVKNACGDLAMFSGAVPGLKDMCSSSTLCCASATASYASNSEWNTCMSDFRNKGAFSKPDFHTIIPDGIPDELVTGRTRMEPNGSSKFISSAKNAMLASVFTIFLFV